jgi:hypothetical protein
MSVMTGDGVAYVDDAGVTWFGVAVTAIRNTRRWPVVLVEIGSRRVEVPARDVTAWPTPEALAEHECDDSLLTAVAATRKSYLCRVGDSIVVAEPITAAAIRPQARHSGAGVITGVTSSGKLIVHLCRCAKSEDRDAGSAGRV